MNATYRVLQRLATTEWGWMSADELAEDCDCTHGTVLRSLGRLRKARFSIMRYCDASVSGLRLYFYRLRQRRTTNNEHQHLAGPLVPTTNGETSASNG